MRGRGSTIAVLAGRGVLHPYNSSADSREFVIGGRHHRPGSAREIRPAGLELWR
jgi:hypothetical protein